MADGPYCVIGAGPAGLAAAHYLTKSTDCATVVLEGDPQVGGLSRTVEHKGFRCDIGGHRFFTKSQEVERLWREVLPSDFLRRPRLSRIYYRGKFFNYPIRLGNALAGLGPWEGLQVLASFGKARLSPTHPELSFEDWVSNRFGYRLYSMFFRTYTEKLWGIRGTDLSADWAAQRIRNLDLSRTLLNAMGIGRGKQVASLIDEFDYPRLGPGQMYEGMAEQCVSRGGKLLLRHRVAGLRHENGRVVALEVDTPDGRLELDAGKVVSTMPLNEVVQRMNPLPSPDVLEAAGGLTYRSIMTVNLMLDRAETVPDTWVYLHAPEVLAGRLQLYKNWSPEMVPDPRFSSLGLEYFATEGDSLWSNSDRSLLEIGKKDLSKLGLAKGSEVFDGFVTRYPKAYPVYNDGYQGRVDVLRSYLAQFSNLECAGRYGQFRYNNMDHSIMTGMLAARRLCGEQCDPWGVNSEGEYLEQR